MEPDQVIRRGELRVEQLSRVALRPIGSPLPLGFLALGGASLVLTGLQLGWVASAYGHSVGMVVIVFAVPLQALASVFGFLARDSVGGTGMATLAGTWLATGTVLLTSKSGSTSSALGLLLAFAGAALMVPTAAASLGKVAAAIVMFGAGGRFALTAVYELGGGTGWKQVSGWWGLGLCVVALYAALAFELEDTKRKTVLPVLRHGMSREAVNGDLSAELTHVWHEAGVREQL